MVEQLGRGVGTPEGKISQTEAVDFLGRRFDITDEEVNQSFHQLAIHRGEVTITWMQNHYMVNLIGEENFTYLVKYKNGRLRAELIEHDSINAAPQATGHPRMEPKLPDDFKHDDLDKIKSGWHF